MSAEGKTRLETWKAVAAFLGKDERTVKRWEATRGLPVRRLPGPGRSRVYAEIAELETWRLGVDNELIAPDLAVPTPLIVAPKRLPWRGIIWAAIGAVALALGAGWLASRQPRSVAGATAVGRPPPLEAQRLYVAGMDDWSRRSPESLNRAIGEFDGAIARDPGYAEAYVGLANTYNMLRQYTQMPSSEAFPLAKAAAEHALSLDDRLADAHAALAYADYWGFWDIAGARRQFARAIALDPRSVAAHHWFATFLTEDGDSAGALAQIQAAHRLDPNSPSIAADEAIVLFNAGRVTESVAELKAVEAAHPDFLSPHGYLAEIALDDGADQEFLRESKRAALLTNDGPLKAEVAAARTGLAHGGHEGFLKALLASRIQRFNNGQASAYAVAATEARLGDVPSAAAFLRLSIDRREWEALRMKVDPALEPLRRDAAYAGLAARIKPIA